MSTTYKGHTITKEGMTTTVQRVFNGSRYDAIVNLYSVAGPVCNMGPGCARWTTSVADAKRRINDAIELAAFETANATPFSSAE